ncbi:hypothetical protein NDN08_003791 [Rhodosorus marinus]|uniref:Uncharacterized protein n=1 Tax=Rhodosorus marinus TaxID=101924 RepID=A0AAV8UKI0_9RHOD|nr:hypothetical protein NDN08_003791 [Rhodosorus marinus]
MRFKICWIWFVIGVTWVGGVVVENEGAESVNSEKLVREVLISPDQDGLEGAELGQEEHRPAIIRRSSGSNDAAVPDVNNDGKVPTDGTAPVGEQKLAEPGKELRDSVNAKRDRLISLSHKKQEIAGTLEKMKERTRLQQKSLNTMLDLREQEQEVKRQYTENLQSVKSALPALTRNLDSLEAERRTAEVDLKHAQTRLEDLKDRLDNVEDGLKHLDLETWLSESASISPMMREAFKLTRDTMNPAIEGLSTIKQTMGGSNPSSLNSFMLAILLYLMVLFPIVLVLSVLFQVKRSLSNLTLDHVVMMGSGYFGVLSCLCTFATLLYWRDLLIVVHDKHPVGFDLFVVMQSFLFWAMTICQIRASLDGEWTSSPFLQCSGLITIGVYFILSLPAKLQHEGANPASALISYIMCSLLFLWLVIEKDKVMPYSFTKSFLNRRRRARMRQSGPAQMGKNGILKPKARP